MSTAILFLAPALIVLMLAMPLLPVYRRVTTGKRAKGVLIGNICAFFALTALMVIFPVGDLVAFAAEAGGGIAGAISTGAGMGYLAAALSTGMAALGAGIAVASASSAAIGAVSEDPKALGKVLIFVALGEGVALYGLLISILIINNL